MSSALFVDVSNLYSRVSKIHENRMVDYQKLITLASTFGELERAFAYGTQIRNQASSFIGCLRKFGYEPRFKRHVMSDDNSKIVHKATWDVEIAVDMITQASRVGTIILASADSDLLPAIQYVHYTGAKVVVIGCGLSEQLKRNSDMWFEIDERLLVENNEPLTEDKISKVFDSFVPEEDFAA